MVIILSTATSVDPSEGSMVMEAAEISAVVKVTHSLTVALLLESSTGSMQK